MQVRSLKLHTFSGTLPFSTTRGDLGGTESSESSSPQLYVGNSNALASIFIENSNVLSSGPLQRVDVSGC